MSKQPAIYILTNKRNGTLYTGVSSNLIQRIFQHKGNLFEGFSKKHNCTAPVYYELYKDMTRAITREKQIKNGSRKKKLALIESINPEWQDLYENIVM